MANSAIPSASASDARPMADRPVRTGWVVPLLIVLGHAPLLAVHGRNLWRLPHYQFFPLLLAGWVWLWWMRRPRASAGPPERLPALEWLLLIGAGLLLSAAVALYSPWLAAVAAVLCAGSGMLHSGGRGGLGTLLPVWALLWLLIPPPVSLDVRLIGWLQAFTSRAASGVIDLSGVNHLMEGNVLELPGHRLLVDAACSGVQSLFALLAATALFAVWTRRPPACAVPLIASVLFWTGLMNVVRVTTIALARAWGDVDLSIGWGHDLLAFGLYPITLLLIAGTDRGLRFLCGPIEETWNPLSRWWNRHVAGATGVAPRGSPKAAVRTARGAWGSWTLAVLFACLGAAQGTLLLLPWKAERRAARSVAALDETALPRTAGDWTLSDFRIERRDLGSEWGERSRVWTYQVGSRSAHVSFDYPFTGWHELTRCYGSLGWDLVERRVVSAEGGGHAPHVEAEFAMPSGEHAFLLFGLLDGGGRAIDPPEISWWARLAARMHKNRGAYGLDATTYQHQVFLSSHFRLSEEERETARERFLEFASILQNALAAGEDRGAPE